MENTEQKSSKLNPIDQIDESLEKAKAITFLMAYAAKEGSFKCGDEMAWAHQIVEELIDEALSAAQQLADMAKEAS